ncbi:MAG: hypothetical protein VZR53_16785 [Prevotella sp.]|nr:hypothetical protein [Prevotella sp.]
MRWHCFREHKPITNEETCDNQQFLCAHHLKGIGWIYEVCLWNGKDFYYLNDDIEPVVTIVDYWTQIEDPAPKYVR